MKKLLSVLLCLCMLVSVIALASCGKDNTDPTPPLASRETRPATAATPIRKR